MRTRVIVAVLVVAVLAGGGYAAWRFLGTPEAEGALAGSGTVEAREIQVASLVAGRVTAVGASEGDVVKSGQVLVRIDAAALKEQVAAAKANVSAAKAMLAQARDDGTDAEVDAAKARVDAAKAQLAAARVQLGYATVSAPATATVSVLAIEPGENATPGRALATLTDLDDLYVSVYVPETRIGEVALGDAAKVTTDSSAKTFPGRVEFIASEAEFTPSNVETKEQRVKLVYQVRVRLTGGEDVLKPGMPVDVTFE